MSSSAASAAGSLGRIRVICGPTGSGKSTIAMWLASRYRCAIVSADSRQIYRGFDIGTAKPSRTDREAVAHVGIDIVDPTVRYSAAAWAGAAGEWIGQAMAAQQMPLVVGGTGLYLRALFDGLFAEPDLDSGRRAGLALVLESMETHELRRWVSSLDPSRAALGRTQLLRAIEVALLTGARISDLHAASRPERRWCPCYLLVDPEGELAGSNARRTDAMFVNGWADEVRALIPGVPDGAPAWKSAGYDIVRRLVRGEIDHARAREAIIIETRQYVKRQRTWFRHQLPVGQTVRVNPAEHGWQGRVEAWWNATETTGQ